MVSALMTSRLSFVVICSPLNTHHHPGSQPLAPGRDPGPEMPRGPRTGAGRPRRVRHLPPPFPRPLCSIGLGEASPALVRSCRRATGPGRSAKSAADKASRASSEACAPQPLLGLQVGCNLSQHGVDRSAVGQVQRQRKKHPLPWRSGSAFEVPPAVAPSSSGSPSPAAAARSSGSGVRGDGVDHAGLVLFRRAEAHRRDDPRGRMGVESAHGRFDEFGLERVFAFPQRIRKRAGRTSSARSSVEWGS